MTLAAGSLALALLAIAAGLPSPPTAVLRADDVTPFFGETVRFDASESIGHDEGNGRIVAYRFEFGDGTGTAWQDSPRAQHAFAVVGTVTARVTVRDGRGLEGSASVDLRILTVPPPTGDAPDLFPIDASVRPQDPRVNTPVTVTLTIMNRGRTTAESAHVDVTDIRPNGSTVHLETLSLGEPLAQGETVTLFPAPFPAAEPGDHRIVVVIRDVLPVETFTTDNVREVTMVVLGPDGDGNVRPSAFLDPVVLVLLAAAIVAFFGALALLSRPSRMDRPREEPASPAPEDESPPPPWPP